MLPHIIRRAFVIVAFLTVANHACAGPLALHPENPHYFLWRGKPAVLVTSRAAE